MNQNASDSVDADDDLPEFPLDVTLSDEKIAEHAIQLDVSATVVTPEPVIEVDSNAPLGFRRSAEKVRTFPQSPGSI